MTDNRNPKHIAIIMDGNGRWAKNKHLPRIVGHKSGVDVVREIVEHCVSEKIQVLSLFAFSSENWQRPEQEVQTLLELFMGTLQTQVEKLNNNNVKLRIIGDRTAFSAKLQDKIAQSEAVTQQNSGLTLVIAANYGGRWDLKQAMEKIATKISNGELALDAICEKLISQHLVLADLPEPDLFIRSGGEQRLSNFYLWQLAYAEFYFTNVLWPDFSQQLFIDAINSFKGRQRRFGRIDGQNTEPTTD